MSFSLAGRPTLVVSLFLASFYFLFFIVFAPSHPPSTPHIQKRNAVRARSASRKVITTARVTTTVFTTSHVTISAGDASRASSSSRRQSTSESDSSSTSATSSSAESSSSSSSSAEPSSSSQSRHRTHKTSRTSSSSSVATTSTSTPVLVPTPLGPTPATTFSVPDAPPSLTSASSSALKFIPVPSSSAAPLEAATSSGFWNNKRAVEGTFTVVGLLIAGIIIVLLVVCVKRIKKNRARRYDEALSSNFFDRGDFRPASSPGAGSLNHPALDPFAAGEVVQVPGTAASLHGIVGGIATTPSTPASKSGHGGYSSDDGHTSSHDHSSSNHHGFSSISYHTGLSDSHANLAQSELRLFSQLPKLTPSHSSKLHPEDPFSNAGAVPLSANATSLTYTVFAPYPSAGQVNNNRQADLDASYYADQVHSYYYGSGATAPPPRSFSQALRP